METLKQIGYFKSPTAINDNQTNVVRLKIDNTRGEVKDTTGGLLTPNLGLTDKEFKEILALGRR